MGYRKEFSGRGDPPRIDPAETGDTYRDEVTGRRWLKTTQGWELLRSVQFDALGSEKGQWINAASQEELKFEEWIRVTLNKAAAKYELPKSKKK